MRDAKQPVGKKKDHAARLRSQRDTVSALRNRLHAEFSPGVVAMMCFALRVGRGPKRCVDELLQEARKWEELQRIYFDEIDVHKRLHELTGNSRKLFDFEEPEKWPPRKEGKRRKAMPFREREHEARNFGDAPCKPMSACTANNITVTSHAEFCEWLREAVESHRRYAEKLEANVLSEVKKYPSLGALVARLLEFGTLSDIALFLIFEEARDLKNPLSGPIDAVRIGNVAHRLSEGLSALKRKTSGTSQKRRRT